MGGGCLIVPTYSTQAHCSRWSIGPQKPLAIDLKVGLKQRLVLIFLSPVLLLARVMISVCLTDFIRLPFLLKTRIYSWYFQMQPTIVMS